MLGGFCFEEVCLLCFPCHRHKQFCLVRRQSCGVTAQAAWTSPRESGMAEGSTPNTTPEDERKEFPSSWPPPWLLAWNTHAAKIAGSRRPPPDSGLCRFHPWQLRLRRLPRLQCLRDFQKHVACGAGTILALGLCGMASSPDSIFLPRVSLTAETGEPRKPRPSPIFGQDLPKVEVST